MDDKKEGTRRVYVFSDELYSRIVAFQREKNYASETEAVRKLLDDALKARDTPLKIVQRIKENLEYNYDLHEVAKETLFGHPLVLNIGFDDDAVTFVLKDEGEFRVEPDGETHRRSGFGGGDGGWYVYPSPMGDEVPF